ncbi:hypothetical protein [Oscillatoria sp. FACHB-1406]|uniref:TPR end-of-group domain-containing protein n=1 Tax=Oscillatoria sp. FACHB-1406 TaxID=2692846 RepID=UPI0016887B9E|nr:hypothetical protein [Oscillatoria sp. FACHB-1406]MBD2578975.1 hypothetical protein [Oscillatoria sp. FACHB-1406]
MIQSGEFSGRFRTLRRSDRALENLQQAIALNPEKYREMAKADTDFGSLRGDKRFQSLLEGRLGLNF